MPGAGAGAAGGLQAVARIEPANASAASEEVEIFMNERGNIHTMHAEPERASEKNRGWSPAVPDKIVTILRCE